MKIISNLMCHLLLFSVVMQVSAQTDENIADNINRLTFDFYKNTLAGKEENTFASPYSVSSAFAMIYAGATSTTKDELSKTFYFGIKDEFHKQFAAHQQQLQNNLPKGLALEVANAVWVRKGMNVLPTYQNLMQQYYKAKIEPVDFYRPTEACKIINDWTKEKTHDKIPNIISPESITPDLSLVLTNAIYFKSAWKRAFNKEATQEAPFQLLDKTSVNAPFMHETTQYKYFENKQLQMIELNYTDEASSMIVLLPKTDTDFKTFEQEVSYEKYKKWERNMTPKNVYLYLPKFKIEKSFVLNDALQKMGLQYSFSNAASYPNILEKVNLKISTVLHKSFIEVNEEGTEAAAVTAILVVTTSSAHNLETPQRIIFNANRPFIFFIKDKKTGTILFVGKVMNPLN